MSKNGVDSRKIVPAQIRENVYKVSYQTNRLSVMPMRGGKISFLQGSGTVYIHHTPVHAPWPGVVPNSNQTSCVLFVEDVVSGFVGMVVMVVVVVCVCACVIFLCFFYISVLLFLF